MECYGIEELNFVDSLLSVYILMFVRKSRLVYSREYRNEA